MEKLRNLPKAPKQLAAKSEQDHRTQSTRLRPPWAPGVLMGRPPSLAAPMLNTCCTAPRHYEELFGLTHRFLPWVLACVQVS